MIDSATGRIMFDDGGVVDPQVTRTAFRATPLYAKSKANDVPAPPWSSFELAPRAMDGLAFLFGAELYFNGEVLAIVNLWQIDPNASKSWDDWSMDEEIAKSVRPLVWGQKNAHKSRSVNFRAHA